MAIPISYPLVNGHRYSWVSVEVGANNLTQRGIASIDYGDALTPGKLKGTGPNVVGRTRGDYDGDAEIEMYRLEWENLKNSLGPKGDGQGFGETAFPITVQYAESGQPTVTDTLEGCRVIKTRTGGQEGNDPTKVKLTIDLTRILHNGVCIYSSQSAGG